MASAVQCWLLSTSTGSANARAAMQSRRVCSEGKRLNRSCTRAKAVPTAHVRVTRHAPRPATNCRPPQLPYRTAHSGIIMTVFSRFPKLRKRNTCGCRGLVICMQLQAMPPIACGPAAERAGNGLDSNCFCPHRQAHPFLSLACSSSLVTDFSVSNNCHSCSGPPQGPPNWLTKTVASELLTKAVINYRN